jgi:hypothetical protein
MSAERIMSGEEGGPRQDAGRPSPAVTALLILVGLGLWAGVVRACLLLLVQRGICRELAVALPEPARWLFGLSWWDWFGSYWWVSRRPAPSADPGAGAAELAACQAAA